MPWAACIVVCGCNMYDDGLLRILDPRYIDYRRKIGAPAAEGVRRQPAGGH